MNIKTWTVLLQAQSINSVNTTQKTYRYSLLGIFFFFCSLPWLLKSLWKINLVHVLSQLPRVWTHYVLRVHIITPHFAAFAVPRESGVEWSKAPEQHYPGKDNFFFVEYNNKRLALIYKITDSNLPDLKYFLLFIYFL